VGQDPTLHKNLPPRTQTPRMDAKHRKSSRRLHQRPPPHRRHASQRQSLRRPLPKTLTSAPVHPAVWAQHAVPASASAIPQNRSFRTLCPVNSVLNLQKNLKFGKNHFGKSQTQAKLISLRFAFGRRRGAFFILHAPFRARLRAFVFESEQSATIAFPTTSTLLKMTPPQLPHFQ